MKMEKVISVLLVTICVIYQVTFCSGRTFPLSYQTSFKLSDDLTEQNVNTFLLNFFSFYRPHTVPYFAKHKLCKHLKGSFENMLIEKLKNFDEHFVRKFVHHMCNKESKDMLKLWVQELFDSDGDGYITNNEKHVALHRHSNG